MNIQQELQPNVGCTLSLAQGMAPDSKYSFIVYSNLDPMEAAVVHNANVVIIWNWFDEEFRTEDSLEIHVTQHFTENGIFHKVVANPLNWSQVRTLLKWCVISFNPSCCVIPSFCKLDVSSTMDFRLRAAILRKKLSYFITHTKVVLAGIGNEIYDFRDSWENSAGMAERCNIL